MVGKSKQKPNHLLNTATREQINTIAENLVKTQTQEFEEFNKNPRALASQLEQIKMQLLTNAQDIREILERAEQIGLEAALKEKELVKPTIPSTRRPGKK